MIDLSPLHDMPAMKVAAEAMGAVEAALLAKPDLAEGDPETFKALFVVMAFARAGGDCAHVTNYLDAVAASAPVEV